MDLRNPGALAILPLAKNATLMISSETPDLDLSCLAMPFLLFFSAAIMSHWTYPCPRIHVGAVYTVTLRYARVLVSANAAAS